MPELVSHMGRDAGLDATRPQGDQPQTQPQTQTGIIQRQGKMTPAVNQ